MKNKKVPITVIILSIAVIILCLVFDYFNLPTKMGINVSIINMDFWGILLGNGIVIALFIITFSLFDKRNLEKEKLADYAGAVLLTDTYRRCETFLPILKRFLEIDETDKKLFSEDICDFIINEPFKNNDKIFESLGNGHISRKHYETYTVIKRNYETLVYHLVVLRKFPEIEENLFEKLVEDLHEEQKILKQYIDGLK